MAIVVLVKIVVEALSPSPATSADARCFFFGVWTIGVRAGNIFWLGFFSLLSFGDCETISLFPLSGGVLGDGDDDVRTFCGARLPVCF